MGYGNVPDITDEAIVCQAPCVHTDCKLTRDQWTDAVCCLCGKPMLAGQPFYYEEKNPVHAHCMWDKNESTTDES